MSWLVDKTQTEVWCLLTESNNPYTTMMIMNKMMMMMMLMMMMMIPHIHPLQAMRMTLTMQE
jgi:hypothetical protein